MIRSLWTATTGMGAQQLNMDVIANNLANVNTTGFKRSRADFHDLLYQIVKVPGSPTSADTKSPTGIQIGVGVQAAAVQKIFAQGDMVQTENELDVAIEGDGFFQVELTDGNTAYTRAGSLKRDANGRLVTSEGYPVQPEITIPENARSVTISEAGVISATLGDATESTELGTFQLATFVNNGGLLALGRNMFRESDSSGAAALGTPGTDGYGKLSQGYLESSNVNLITEMASMITTQRAYEINSKAITTSDEMMQTTNNMV
ncbi:MAG: flagellar basal-body rod protein FlgG [Desulfobulbaceae bacterium A2]|nr:MAG: flagellar basal-body rod protein FlgG [Desulfobulbaceae bacterium A2]